MGGHQGTSWEHSPTLMVHNRKSHQARHQETVPKESEPQEGSKQTLQKRCRKGEHPSDPPEPQQGPTEGGAKTAEKCRQICNKSERRPRPRTDARPKSKKRCQAQQDAKHQNQMAYTSQRRKSYVHKARPRKGRTPLPL